MLANILTNYDKDLWIVMWFLFHFNSQYYNYNTVRIWNTTYYHLQLILIKIMSFFKIIKLFSPCVLLWILYFDSVVPIVMILLVLSYGLYTCGLFYLCKWSWSYLCYVDDNMLLQIRLMLLVGDHKSCWWFLCHFWSCASKLWRCRLCLCCFIV